MYPSGVVAEHLATRRRAGLFDVSHMGRFILRGAGALPGPSARTQQQRRRARGGPSAVHLHPHRHRRRHRRRLPLPLLPRRVPAGGQRRQPRQGPGPSPRRSRRRPSTTTPPSWPCCRSRARSPARSSAASSRPATSPSPGATSSPWSRSARPASYWPAPATPARPLASSCSPRASTRRPSGIFLSQKGAVPCGLGARDTLRLEAGLPLYGHELGADPEGNEIPLFSSPLAQFAVSFSPVKGDYRRPRGPAPPAGRPTGASSPATSPHIADLPAPHPAGRRHRPRRGPGRARPSPRRRRPPGRLGHQRHHGPLLEDGGRKLGSHPGDESRTALHLPGPPGQRPPRRRRGPDRHPRPPDADAVVVPYHLRSDAPPYARPIVYRPPEAEAPLPPLDARREVGAPPAPRPSRTTAGGRRSASTSSPRR